MTDTVALAALAVSLLALAIAISPNEKARAYVWAVLLVVGAIGWGALEGYVLFSSFTIGLSALTQVQNVVEALPSSQRLSLMEVDLGAIILIGAGILLFFIGLSHPERKQPYKTPD